MKTLLLSIVGVSLLSLAACQTSSTADGSRHFDTMGANGRYAADLPPSNGARTDSEPYALTGAPTAMPAIPSSGYQARN